MKNPRNRNHTIKKVVSKSKFQRILKNNLDSTGYAYIMTGVDSIKKSWNAVQIGKFVYCQFVCKDVSKGSYFIRYSLDKNEACDMIAFQQYPDGIKRMMEILNAD